MREEVMLVMDAAVRSLMSFFIHHLKDYSERDFQSHLGFVLTLATHPYETVQRQRKRSFSTGDETEKIRISLKKMA